MPSEAQTQPPYAEPLPVQVDEGQVVVIAVEESAAPPPPVAAAAAGEERTVTEAAAPQARSKPQAGTGPGDDDVVML
jgi:hypothetical protein